MRCLRSNASGTSKNTVEKLVSPLFALGLAVFGSWKSGPSGVQFHDILYKTFRDILYTPAAGIAVRVGMLGHGGIGSNSQIRVRR